MNFAETFGIQYLINELRWVSETSQAEFLSEVDEEKLKVKI